MDPFPVHSEQPVVEQEQKQEQGQEQEQEQDQKAAQTAVEQPQIHDHAVQPEQDMPPSTEDVLSDNPSYHNGFGNGQRNIHSSHSADYPSTTAQQDGAPLSRYSSPAMSQQNNQQPNQPISRPGSGLSGGGDRYGYPPQYQEPIPKPSLGAPTKNSVVIKVGMVGDAQIGKTSLMVKYVEGSWDEDYIQTLGVNFMEKTISIRNTEITFSIWDLGGQREFVNMLPLVCNDAVAILFMFDLTRKSTLNSIKEWYRQGRGFNKTAIPLLVGTKYDHFVNFPREDQEEISIQAKRFAKAMRASLIFSSTSHSINVQKIFKIVLSKAFDLKCTIPEIENIGEPLLLYQSVG
ncbi:septum-promoting GTP-binding protein 1 [Polytolypa hystricis UAMH7299]|uniref:Septum-promoting GTP-binding protein 1 n=1 Tax=Polytolypa hystricis (strain UAMH7299) TaxID=1447883 RepID=A0A2B7YT45_POLH7|nr:septum-promoting GTP-binding protein 1 [Polytolypa hystricis UAMH7299]